jgi:hypothetical protein
MSKGFFLTASLSVLASATIAATAFAYDFSAADAAFANRTDAAQAAQAISLYQGALGQTPGTEKIYAVEQLGRLDYYLGNSLPESNAAGRKVVFQRCLDNTDSINPSKYGSDTPAYRYWKALCLASWAKANGVLASLEKAGEVIENIEKGKALDETYEGGGFYRVGSAVYLNLPAVFGGSVDKAWDYAQKAISSPAYSGALNPDTETGNYHYGVYLYAAQIAAKREGKPEAKAIVQAALDRINSGDIPVGREPETAISKAELEAYLSTLN